MLENPEVLQLGNSYTGMFKYVLTPILERYGVPEKNRAYIMTFYIHGLMAIVEEWLKNSCTDSVEYIIEVMQQCVIGRERKASV